MITYRIFYRLGVSARVKAPLRADFGANHLGFYRKSSKKYEMLDKMKMKETANLKIFMRIFLYINNVMPQPNLQTVWET